MKVLKLPLIILNFKTYEEATGKGALRLSKIVEKISQKHGVDIVVVPQFYDIYLISKTTKVPVFTQHIDAIRPGAHTGHSLAKAARESGAIGTLLNHSERRLPLKEIEKTVEIAKEVGLMTVVCVHNLSLAKKVLRFNPTFIAYEPPELIGTGKAVSKVKPKIVEKFSMVVRSSGVIPLCGAGISDEKDVKKAIELGMSGVLLSSAFVKARDPKSTLEKMVMALKF